MALDPDTGKLKWHFQFTPHDVHDWDSKHTPILFDDTMPAAAQTRRGRQSQRILLRAGSSDRRIFPQPGQHQGDVGERVDANGRPVVLPGTDPTAEGNRVCPSGTGGTNWHSPSYSPRTHLVYFFSNEQCDTFMSDEHLEPPYRPGRPFIGSAFFALPDERIETAVRAVDPKTATVKWVFKQYADAWAGVASTAGGLVFSGRQGNFIALDAETGKDLWHIPLGAWI